MSERSESNGGGGNRTRVPKHFHVSFYVRSRLFGSRRQGPGRQGTWLASRELLLASGVPGNDPKRVGFGD